MIKKKEVVIKMKKIISLGILLLILVLPVFAHGNNDENDMMQGNDWMSMHSWWSFGFFGMLFMGVFCLLLVATIIALIVWIVLNLSNGGQNVRSRKKNKK